MGYTHTEREGGRQVCDVAEGGQQAREVAEGYAQVVEAGSQEVSGYISRLVAGAARSGSEGTWPVTGAFCPQKARQPEETLPGPVNPGVGMDRKSRHYFGDGSVPAVIESKDGTDLLLPFCSHRASPESGRALS